MPAYVCLLIGPPNSVLECGAIAAGNAAEAMAQMEHAFGGRAELTAIEIWDRGHMDARLTSADLVSWTGPRAL